MLALVNKDGDMNAQILQSLRGVVLIDMCTFFLDPNAATHLPQNRLVRPLLERFKSSLSTLMLMVS
jgi:hypothetical protein